MSYITRLTWNSKDWNLPSGFSNKSVKNENYEADSGFGFEDQLFNSIYILNACEYVFTI